MIMTQYIDKDAVAEIENLLDNSKYYDNYERD